MSAPAPRPTRLEGPILTQGPILPQSQTRSSLHPTPIQATFLSHISECLTLVPGPKPHDGLSRPRILSTQGPCPPPPGHVSQPARHIAVTGTIHGHCTLPDCMTEPHHTSPARLPSAPGDRAWQNLSWAAVTWATSTKDLDMGSIPPVSSSETFEWQRGAQRGQKAAHAERAKPSPGPHAAWLHQEPGDDC